MPYYESLLALHYLLAEVRSRCCAEHVRAVMKKKKRPFFHLHFPFLVPDFTSSCGIAIRIAIE